MIPFPFVVFVVGALNVLHKIQVAQAVTTAASASFSAGATAGAAAGLAAGAGVSNPRIVPFVISLPLRIMNAPFYYLLGGHSADQRLKVLELAAANMNEAQTRWLRTLQEKSLQFDV